MIAPAPYSRNRNTQRQRQGVIGSPGLATSRTRAVKVHCELSASQLKVKLMLAQNSCKLDLSESSLEAIPDGVFDLNGLEELSLAGNNIRELPDCFDCLPSLQRLNLAGNRLNKLPDSICALTRLQGLWVHGNVLDTVPSNIGSLCDLVTISLAGNCLPAVPDSLMQLTALTELNIAGNKLERLPGPVSSLSSLQKVLLHGNQLKELPAGFGELESLQILRVMGNDLKTLPKDLMQNSTCTEINASDNELDQLPTDWSGMTSMHSLLLYGNQIQNLSCSIASLPALSGVWIEGNPLQNASEFCAAAACNTSLKNLGMAQEQLSGVSIASLPSLKLSRLCTSTNTSGANGLGYFKLVPSTSSAANNGVNDMSNGFTGRSSGAAECVVVAFGSAPGEPNWAGLLGRIAKSSETPKEQPFDVLYVVDTKRSWYGGGDREEFNWWHAHIQQAVASYPEVVMVGDSMGATAALLFSDLATKVVAFCPQVNLLEASIRPGQDESWFERCTDTIVQHVKQSSASIQVHTGTWQHDLRQAQALPDDKVVLHVHPLDSHRLAFALDAEKKLLPIVHDAIAAACGYSTGNVRAANLL